MTHDITAILLSADAEGPDALDRLLPLVYEELRGVAHNRLAAERPDHTLSTTALVHETYLRLVDQTRVRWRNRVHFFAVAARAMRRILVDHARRHARAKRGGGFRRVELEAAELTAPERAETLLEIDDAVERLARFDPRLGRVVEYRFFGGLDEADIAEALGVTARTVRRDWARARGLLYTWLLADEGEDERPEPDA